jgi:hypothetical protein
MPVSRLQLHLTRAVTSVDDPGTWNLLEIRDLTHFDSLGSRR